MSDVPPNLTEQEREQLVAYLDGELSPEECTEIEERLSQSSTYRNELQKLTEAWDMLDTLPRQVAGENFAQTTIEMITVAAKEEVSAASRSGKTTFGKALWGKAAVLAATLLVGFFIARIIWPVPNRQLLTNLPVIEQLDALSYVHDIEFLRQLNTFLEEHQVFHSSENSAQIVQAYQSLADASFNKRREYISSMAPEEELKLAANFARFQELTTEEKQSLQRLQQTITKDANAPALIGTLLQYAAWLEERTPGERADLREAAVQSKSTKQRLEQLKRLFAKDQKRLRRSLSQADLDKLQKATISFADAHRKKLIEIVPKPFKPSIEKMTGHQLAILLFRSPRNWQRISKREQPEAIQKIQREFAKLRVQGYASLQSTLSEEPQQFLKSLRSNRDRIRTLARWIDQAFRPAKSSQQTLEAFFVEELTNDQRARLLSMPTAEMQRALEQLYNQKKMGGQFWPGNGRGSGKGHGPGNGRGPGSGRGLGRSMDDRPKDHSRPNGPHGPGRGRQDGRGPHRGQGKPRVPDTRRPSDHPSR